MKALVLEETGLPFQLREVSKPAAGPGQVLVKIAASGVNPLDLKIKAGQAAHAQVRLPAILGIDMAGVVEAVGEGVTQFSIGDAVYGMTGGVGGVQGSLAEYAAVDADLLASAALNLSLREAAALPLIFITAWEGLVDRAGVREGQTVLVHGGAGGVGHIAVQLAVARGAQVFATVGSSGAALIQQYGATPIDYTRLSVAEYVREYTGGKGFDIVVDTVGGSVLDGSFTAVKRYTGHVVSILGWGTHSLAPLSFRGATALVEAGKLAPLVDGREYGFDQVETAYLSLQQGGARGKVVITIS
jgi:NADPH:quinone reductase-like Zn-dependent oxidoreductase